MAINLTGFISGYAKGATKRIDDEREKEETALANRFKLAAVNKMTREKEANELKGLYAERIKNFNAAYPEAAEEEVLAAVSTETSYNTLMDAHKSGSPLNLKEHLVLNKDSIPEGFTTARSYLDKVLTPQVTRGSASDQTRYVMGADVSPSEKARARAASQYGASADELEAYAQSSGAVADLPSFGSVVAVKKKKTIEERMKEASMSYADAVDAHGKDSDQALSAKNAYDGLQIIKDTLDPDKADWASTVSTLKMTMLNGETPEIRAAAGKEYDRVLAIEAKGKKEDSGVPTVSILARLFSSTASRALNEKFGSEQSKDLIIETLPDGSGTYKYIGQDSAKRKEVNDYARSVIEKMVQPYLDKNGVPINTDVATALRSMLIPFDDQGRPIFAPMPSAGPSTNGQEGKPKATLPPATGQAPAAPAPAAQEAPQEKKVTMAQIKQMATKRAENPNNTLPTDVATIMEDMKKNGYAIIGE